MQNSMKLLLIISAKYFIEYSAEYSGEKILGGDSIEMSPLSCCRNAPRPFLRVRAVPDALAAYTLFVQSFLPGMINGFSHAAERVEDDDDRGKKKARSTVVAPSPHRRSRRPPWVRSSL